MAEIANAELVVAIKEKLNANEDIDDLTEKIDAAADGAEKDDMILQRTTLQDGLGAMDDAVTSLT
jgi:hypothetical protein